MKRKLRLCFLYLLLLTGCERSMLPELLPVETKQYKALLATSPETVIDSAQVFFFRKTGVSDTLVLHEIIRGISFTPKAFRFNLPAGDYTMSVWANVATDRIVSRPPYSYKDIFVEYRQGQEPPVIYNGVAFFHAGIDTGRVSGLMLVTAMLELTIQKVPLYVASIHVELSNTGAGVSVNGYYIKETINPPLSKTLVNVKADSTYIMSISSFPTVLKNGKSQLTIQCYNQTGRLVYTTVSAPFEMRSRIKNKITCAFEEQPLPQQTILPLHSLPTVREKTDKGYTTQWQYEKIPF